MNTTYFKKSAFTIVELLVVVAIIGILAALLFPALGVMNARSKKTKCLSNLRQIAMAGVSLMGESKETIPFSGESADVAAQLLPTMRNMAVVFDCPANQGIGQEALPSPYAGKSTDYTINENVRGGGKQSKLVDLSQVVFAYDPNKTVHEDGLNVSYLDGHGVFVTANLTPADLVTGIRTN